MLDYQKWCIFLVKFPFWFLRLPCWTAVSNGIPNKIWCLGGDNKHLFIAPEKKMVAKRKRNWKIRTWSIRNYKSTSSSVIQQSPHQNFQFWCTIPHVRAHQNCVLLVFKVIHGIVPLHTQKYQYLSKMVITSIHHSYPLAIKHGLLENHPFKQK